MMKSLAKYSDYAPLAIRLLLGTTLVFSHGIPKLMEGPERWEGSGRAMANLGITFAPMFWGFMVGATEALAGVLFWLGLAVRPASVLMLFVMFVAALQNVVNAGGLAGLAGGRAHPIDFAGGCLALLLLGAGAYSLDRKLGLERPASAEPTSRSRVSV
jgi:putative oxidoreductase